MAKFQERVYHPDTTPRRPMTAGDAAFLLDLQKELNTQPNMGNAQPLYFGIAQTKERPTGADFADASVAVDACGDVVARDLKSLAEYLDDGNVDGVAGCAYFNKSCTITFAGGEKDSAYSVESAVEALKDRGIGALSVSWIAREHDVVTSALFLTHKDCEEHLESYGYNYEPDAHAYAMTAIRSPRYEKLLEIIRSVDWAALNIAGTGGRA